MKPEEGVGPPLGIGLLLRAAAGGVLMGLANLVPGISGGTMLLAVGIYPVFVAAVADVTTLRWNRRALVVLAAVAGAAVLAILLLAGAVQQLVVEKRWIMYSLFVGLTLGGLPIVWRLARPATRAVGVGAAGGFVAMAALAIASAAGATGGAGGGGEFALLFLSGLGGASAMILPGISGGYILLVLGQYETILGAIDDVKGALIGSGGPDLAALAGPLAVVIPVGLGVVAGIVGVSNLLKWLLRRFEKATLGVLLGLLVGAVVGLWPFQEGVPPQPGDLVRGVVLDVESAAAVEPEDWPVRIFRPSPVQGLAALALVLAGYGLTRGIDRIGRTGRS